jgi:glycosyltransferase involved in cell wall biosynthesis
VAEAGAGIACGTSPEDIAKGLALMIDPATREAMSARALALARGRFSLEAMGAQLKQLYTDILSRRHGLPSER